MTSPKYIALYSLRFRVLLVASVLSIGTQVLSAQRLQQTHTAFLHGFASSDAIWTTPFPGLGNLSVIDYLSQHLDLREVWHPSFPGIEPTFPTEWTSVRSSIIAKGGRHALVGHSVGGMVARYAYFADGDAAARPNIAGIVTLATPHQGAILADSALKMGAFINDLNRRIDDAKPYLEVAAVIVATAVGGTIGILVASNNRPQPPAAGSSGADLLRTAVLPALQTTSSAVQALNANGPDAAIPRANIVARLDNNKFMPLKVLAGATGESEKHVIDNFQKARSWFHGCKIFYYATILGTPAGRKCGWAERVMGRLDETWQRYSNGSTPVVILGRVIHVPRNIPTDGVVPNERSLYPFRTAGQFFFEMLPAVGTSHMSVYKTEIGAGLIRDALVNAGMEAAGTRLSPDPYYLAFNKSSSFLREWNVHGTLVFGGVYWQPQVWMAGIDRGAALGMHAPASGIGAAEFRIPAGAKSFVTVFGYARDDNGDCYGYDDVGRIYVDNVLRWQGTLSGSTWNTVLTPPAIPLSSNSAILRLEVEAGGNNACAQTTWGDPRFAP